MTIHIDFKLDHADSKWFAFAYFYEDDDPDGELVGATAAGHRTPLAAIVESVHFLADCQRCEACGRWPNEADGIDLMADCNCRLCTDCAIKHRPCALLAKNL